MCRLVLTGVSNSLEITEHPIEVLGYAIRHGYHDVRDHAAPLSLDETFGLARKSLSTEGLLAWVGLWTEVYARADCLSLTHRSHIVKSGSR